MSGFGEAMGEAGGARVEVQVRSVNGRFLDVRATLPDALARLQPAIEARVRASIPRGKVDVKVRLGRGRGASALRVDDAGVDKALELLDQCERWLGVDRRNDDDDPRGGKRVADLVALRDLFLVSADDEGGPSDAEVLALVDEALARHGELAAREGARTAAHVLACVQGIQGHLERFDEALARGAPARREALLERLREALAAVGAVDRPRAEQEVALLVERADVSEELARAASHLAEMERLLKADVRAPAGKKLEYLCVELHRELTTSAAKNALPEAAAPLVEARLLNEQIREQSANVV